MTACKAGPPSVLHPPGCHCRPGTIGASRWSQQCPDSWPLIPASWPLPSYFVLGPSAANPGNRPDLCEDTTTSSLTKPKSDF